MSESWRIGILFSRTGVTGATESEHFRGAALAVEEINRAGGVLGLPVEPVAYDPGATPAGYRAAADRLLGTDGVNVIFGCSTSSCRKAVLPAVERRNGLLWYPSLYEGFEYSPNVIYTGAVPNQLVYQLAAWMAREHGPRVACIGSDYIYPREMNRVMRDVAERLGGGIALERYVPMEADAATVGEAVAALGADRGGLDLLDRGRRAGARLPPRPGRCRATPPAGGQPDARREHDAPRRPWRLRGTGQRRDLPRHHRHRGQRAVRCRLSRALRRRGR